MQKKNHKTKKRSKTTKRNKTKIPNKFIIKYALGNLKYYIFHRKNSEYYDLRYRDRKCKGTAKYIIDKEETIITKECSIKDYYEHNYTQKVYITKK